MDEIYTKMESFEHKAEWLQVRMLLALLCVPVA